VTSSNSSVHICHITRTHFLFCTELWGKYWGGWWRWALVNPDGVAPSRMSVCLPL